MTSPYIEPEHLLLGIAREPSLSDQWFSLISHLTEFRSQVKPPAKPLSKSQVDLPLSTSSKRVLAFAAEEAERAHHYWIGTEHLLLGILREQSPDCMQMLKDKGVTLETAREKVRELKQDPPAQVYAASTPMTIVQRRWLICAAVSGWVLAILSLIVLFNRP